MVAHSEEKIPLPVAPQPTNPSGSTPVPDPTVLTATAVAQAKADLRRELNAQRDLVYERIDGLSSRVDITVQELERLSITRPEFLKELRKRLQKDINTSVTNLQLIQEEKFVAVQQQFTERDVRGEQEKKSSKEALDAALLAQKESVSQQNDANTTAATKSETSFTKQIDQIGTLIATLEKSLTDRITELKERIDRGEGVDAGGQQNLENRDRSQDMRQTADYNKTYLQRNTASVVIAAISALIALLAVVFAIYVASHHSAPASAPASAPVVQLQTPAT